MIAFSVSIYLIPKMLIMIANWARYNKKLGRFIESQVTRSEQLSQQLQKEVTNLKQKYKNEVWPTNTAILCDGFTKRREFKFKTSDS